MGAVRELERELVLARAQLDFGFALALAEMQMLGVHRDNLTGWNRRSIDNQMVMTGSGDEFARRLDFHSIDPELHEELLGDLLAVLQVREKGASAFRSGNETGGRNGFHRFTRGRLGTEIGKGGGSENGDSQDQRASKSFHHRNDGSDLGVFQQ